MKSIFTSLLLLCFSTACSPASLSEEAEKPQVDCSNKERGACLFEQASQETNFDRALALHSEACEEEFALSCGDAAELLMQNRTSDFPDKSERDQIGALAEKGCQLRNGRSCLISGMIVLAEIEAQVGHTLPDQWPEPLARRYFEDLWVGCEMEEPLACAFYADKSVKADFPRLGDENAGPQFLREQQAALKACDANIIIGCTAYGVSQVRARPTNFEVAADYFWMGCAENSVEACVYLTQVVTEDMNKDLLQEQLIKFCTLDSSEATLQGLDCKDIQ
ncbi:hypothetical protein [Henriciella litoralis]|uniref:hypothetical protein n=1 Tax=Henriciella litoralis TaxID=568102 RepID=UPI000A00CBE9|nr:hypothetical protein [Henriciella litoralis]